ncbi:type II toxin-antitoxin system RelE/ParE family toxin [Pseudomonas sp. WS 5096]|uniref:Type II toxin-antitoxin system RelE/ParE family toxin n=1 Tax=Pseudomonas cremoris TaxID=2724178 RepID=A0ABR6THQ7_9PSED|nr:type II toxin-antitoxin system RelE/ParE family toxin [Pseudomonas cremoris]MBC2385315.1 type II toxin-antitoxin system RelE/ParE family toxin [Pseudomonas cremoris]
MKTATKKLKFSGSSLSDLRAFPDPVRRMAGFQLGLVQEGQDPDDWKPMTTIGAGVREIRIREASGAFRVIYIAKFESAIFVLHCFQKKTQKTSREDIALATQRLKDVMKELDK